MDNDKLALDRVRKARTELILTQTFYGVLVGQVEPIISRRVPTAATNGKTHYWNPDYVATLTQDELISVQQHESEHDARRHHTRRGGRDPGEWNICTDFAINIDLIDAGRKLPKGALVDPKYRGMSAEDIYRIRELDRQKQPQPSEPQEQDEDGDAADDAGDQGEQDDPEQESGEDEGEGAEGEPNGERQDGQEGADEADGGDPSGGEGEGHSEQPDGQGEAGQGEEGGEGDGGEGEGEGEPIGRGDCGGMGEVLDAADDAAELSTEDAKWEQVLKQAASLAKRRGDMPGHITREIERADNPQVDWRETLRAWFDQGAVQTETWARPNRRFVGSGLYLPGRQRDGLNRVVFLVDTSGSMDAIALRCVRTEAQAALDEGIIDEAVVIYGDTRVTKIDEYRNGDEIEFDPRGGGGTDLRPLFKHVADEVDASLIVAFTDLFIGDAGPEPACPVLWAVTGYPLAVRDLIANTPWGSPGIDVGAH